MKRVNLVDLGEFLSYAATHGYAWNDTCKLLAKDRVLEGGGETLDLTAEYIDDELWSTELKNLLKAFMKKEKISRMVLMRD